MERQRFFAFTRLLEAQRCFLLEKRLKQGEPEVYSDTKVSVKRLPTCSGGWVKLRVSETAKVEQSRRKVLIGSSDLSQRVVDVVKSPTFFRFFRFSLRFSEPFDVILEGVICIFYTIITIFVKLKFAFKAFLD